MPKKTADEVDRWVFVTVTRDDLKRIQKRRDAFNGNETPSGETKPTTTDGVASRLLAWAIEHAPEPLP